MEVSDDHRIDGWAHRAPLEQEPALAWEFVRNYAAVRPPRPGFPVYALDERLAIWELAQRTRFVWWAAGLALRGWAEPFITCVAHLAEQ